MISNEILQKMHETEFSRYLAEVVYVIWFHIFSTSVPMYKNNTREMMSFGRNLFEYIRRKLKPMRDIEVIYRKLFEACGTCRLKEEILELFEEMK